MWHVPLLHWTLLLYFLLSQSPHACENSPQQLCCNWVTFEECPAVFKRHFGGFFFEKIDLKFRGQREGTQQRTQAGIDSFLTYVFIGNELSSTDIVDMSECIKSQTRVKFRQTTLCDKILPSHAVELDLCVAQQGCRHTGLQPKNAGLYFIDAEPDSTFQAMQCNIIRCLPHCCYKRLHKLALQCFGIL